MLDTADSSGGGDDVYGSTERGFIVKGSIQGGADVVMADIGGEALGATFAGTVEGGERDGHAETPRPSMQSIAGRVNNATGILDRYPTVLLSPPTRSLSRNGGSGGEGGPNPHLLRSLEGGGGGGTPSNEVTEGGFTLCPARGVLAGEGCETFSGAIRDNERIEAGVNESVRHSPFILVTYSLTHASNHSLSSLSPPSPPPTSVTYAPMDLTRSSYRAVMMLRNLPIAAYPGTYAATVVVIVNAIVTLSPPPNPSVPRTTITTFVLHMLH